VESQTVVVIFLLLLAGALVDELFRAFKPIKFATVFGALSSSKWITMSPCDVSKMAYVPAGLAMKSP
jgi:hypothetical protein